MVAGWLSNAAETHPGTQQRQADLMEPEGHQDRGDKAALIKQTQNTAFYPVTGRELTAIHTARFLESGWCS